MIAGEEELVFPPLTHLEVIGYPRIERYNQKQLVVVSVKVNINQKALTIEEILEQRKCNILAIGDRLEKEIQFDVQLISKNTCCLWKLQRHLLNARERDATWYNSNSNYRSALDQLLRLKEE